MILHLTIDMVRFQTPVRFANLRRHLTACSVVIGLRESASNPCTGITRWYTQGFDQRGERVIDFERTNMMHKREAVSK